MRLQSSTALFTATVMLCGVCRADFKYSETTKITGGAMMGAVKFVSVFSKNAKQAMAPTTHTVAVKGNKMREEQSDGKIQIIDLDGKRFIEIDPQTKTYGVMTFEEMKQAMQRKQQEMQEKMKEEQAKHPDKTQSANVKITPKFESSETGATRTVLGLPTKEVKAKVEMLMESDDPKAQGQQVSTVVNTDQWITQDVPGYGEIRQFYLKMAKEMDWVPGQMMQGMANSNVQVSLAELRKSNVAHITGMPMVSYVSMTMAGNGTAPAAGQNPQTSQQAPPPRQEQEDNSIPTSASGAVMKGLGGMFKKKQQQQQQDSQTAGSASANPASTPGSLMDMQTEVTSFSSESLDDSLFAPPAGYTQTQRKPDEVLGGDHHQ
jgi:hypothetical protein